jgi:uncharacterized hydrophobic protein (TIGR00271 family)
MAVLALITKPEEINLVVPWAGEFARARDSSLVVVCWTYSVPDKRSDESPDREKDDDLTAKVRRFVAESETDGSLFQLALSEGVELRDIHHPDALTVVFDIVRAEDIELLVAASEDQTGKTGATYATNPLLSQSPCNTVILFGGPERSRKADRVFVGVTDTPHDGVALFLASRMAEASESKVTLARSEMDLERTGLEIGRRELQQLMRDAGVEHEDKIERRVFRTGDFGEIASVMDEHDLIVVGANHPRVHVGLRLTKNPTIAVIKRAPPLRQWRRSKRSAEWNTRLSPADYADLVQGLRRGSQFNADFLTMLSLATVVASMGLLQDSPAVVIGSMLLAPLMTPMLGCGLAMAQANPKLGNSALTSVGLGLLCTLAISFLLGIVTPGAELTPQIFARGEPTILDLIVAVASAVAAAYALARPNLVGSIAGVAIATALVPPLCSVGLSLAYQDFGNALGAALLFGTNFVAIVLSAAITFRIMGVAPERVGTRQRTWVFRTAAIFGVLVIGFIVPLQLALMRSAAEVKPQPMTYPLPWVVTEALEGYIEKDPDIQLIAAGRPASPHETSDVVMILGAPRDLEPEYARELIEVVRREMEDDSLVIEVHAIRELWQETTEVKIE